MLTLEEMRMLLRLLEALTEVDRQAGCSDRYFRQLYTARLAAAVSSGILERLARAVAAGERKGESI